MLFYGHRRNPEGYGQAIVEFDHQLEELLYCLNSDDLLMITADHGNDPTYKGTDHTRENVPLIIYSKSLQMPKHLGLLTKLCSLLEQPLQIILMLKILV